MKSHEISKTNENTVKLTVCAIMIAMSTVLSFIKISHLPFGGSVTLFSFVPILFAGYAYGWKWGIGSGLVYGIFQAMFDVSASVAGTGFKWWQVALCAALDYIFAGAVLGMAGIFRKPIKKPQLSFALGTVFACVLKLFVHFLSGYTLFSGWAQSFFEEASYGQFFIERFSGNTFVALYSLLYNSTFMIPELISSTIAVIILISVKPIRKACGIK